MLALGIESDVYQLSHLVGIFLASGILAFVIKINQALLALTNFLPIGLCTRDVPQLRMFVQALSSKCTRATALLQVGIL